jgi:autotransporter-associated beta strand protein
MKTQNLICKILLIPAMLAALAGSALAANGIWSNNGTDFNLPSNWTPGLPGASDRGLFNGTVGTQPSLSSNITMSGLTFNATASGYIISSASGSLTLTSNVTGSSLSTIYAVNTSGTNTISAPIILAPSTQGGGFYQIAGGTLAITGPISSTPGITGLTLTGSASGSKFTLSGNNTYSGNTTIVGASNLLNINSATAISSGTLITGSVSSQTANIDNTSGSAITLANNNVLVGGTLIYGGTNDLNFGTGSLIINGSTRTITTNGNATLTFGSVDASGSGIGFTKSGAGTLAITGAAGSTLNGTVQLSVGAVIIGNKSSFGTGTLALNGATLSASNNLSGVGNSVANAITFQASNTFGGNNSIELSGNATVAAARTLTNSISGGNLTLSGATLGLGNGTAAFLMTMAGTGNTIIKSVMQDNGAAGSLTINNPGGSVTLSGNNTHSGGTNLNGGQLNLGHANALGTGNFVIGGAITSLDNTSGADMTLSGISGITMTNGSSGTSEIIFVGTKNLNLGTSNVNFSVDSYNRTFTVSAGVLTVGGNITAGGGGFVLKNGAGVLALSGNNSGITKIFQLNAGVLRLESTTALPAGIFRSFGGAVELTTASGNLTSTAGDGAGQFSLRGGGFSAYDADSYVDLGTLPKWGAGGFTGTTLTLSSPTAQATIDFRSNIDLNANSGAVRTITVGNGSASVDAKITGVISNSISGAGNSTLLKDGAGTLLLTAANNYTGATTVSTGTLLINGNQSSATGAVTVASGATLGGNGTIGGATTISGGLAPGNSPGLLTFSSSLTLNSTATTTMEINGATTRGTDYDGINVGTALAYGGTLVLNFGTTFSSGNYSFNLFDSGSRSGNFTSVALAGSYSGNLTNTLGVWGLTSGNNTWSFSQATGDLGLSVVPEPAAWVLLALGGTFVTVLRRRRNS